jgi:hypothetical protein
MATRAAGEHAGLPVLERTPRGLTVEPAKHCDLLRDLERKIYVAKSRILSGALFVLEYPIRS